MSRPAAAAILVAALLATLVARASATHAPDHRFLLIGYVTDAKGNPAVGVSVVVTRVKTGLPHPTKTESDGLYFVVVHLHDEDEGELLRVATGGVTAELRARFDVRDTKTERGTRVDFRGGRATETRPLFATTLRDYLAR